MFLVDVPVEKDEAGEQGSGADQQVFSELLVLQFAPLLVEVAQEEETEATDKSMICYVWGIVVVFVGAIKNHGNDR